jgi:hypothetical protein
MVDYGSLLPNKVDLTGNVRASATESSASASTNEVLITYTYTGNMMTTINLDKTSIVSSLDESVCNPVWVKNVDTGAGTAGSGATSITAEPVFINGQTGIMVFDCSGVNGGQGLIKDEYLEGQITISIKSSKTNVSTPNIGPIRLTVMN